MNNNHPTHTATRDFFATDDFNSGSVTVAPTTERGRDLFRRRFGCAGVAPVSVEMPKTKFSEFLIFAEQNGYSV